MATLVVHGWQDRRRWQFLKLLVRELHGRAILDVFPEGDDTVLIYRYEGAITGWRLRPQDFDIGDEHFLSVMVASTLVRRVLQSLVASGNHSPAPEQPPPNLSEFEVQISAALLNAQQAQGGTGTWRGVKATAALSR